MKSSLPIRVQNILHMGKRGKHIDFLPPISEDEAELRMSTEMSSNASDHRISASKDRSSDDIPRDGEHLKSNNQYDAEADDRLLSLLLKKKVERQSKNIEEYADQNQLSQIVEFDENIPPTNMSFLDRLFHQLTRPSAPAIDDLNEDISKETVETTKIDENKFTENNSFLNTIRLFIDDLNKETNVIRGVAGQDDCLNQRSPNKKSSFSSMDDNRITSF